MFLGLPLISSKLSINQCMPLIQKITKRIDSWTTMFLSFAGRAQLVKTTLFVVQCFRTSHFWLLKAVHKDLQKAFTRFIWKGDYTKIGGAKVTCENICFGFKCPTDWNKAQLLHHFWKLIIKQDSLWMHWEHSTILKHKHLWVTKVPTYCSWF